MYLLLCVHVNFFSLSVVVVDSSETKVKVGGHQTCFGQLLKDLQMSSRHSIVASVTVSTSGSCLCVSLQGWGSMAGDRHATR